jgi:hypothetical protein
MARSRDDALLRHLGLYRLSLRPVLARRFFGGRDPGNVLLRLRRAGLIDESARNNPLAPLTYYQLTPLGTRGRVPLARAAKLNTRALEKHLAVLWFCCMGPTPRERLEPAAVVGLFGPGVPAARFAQLPHCLEDSAHGRRVHRLYVPGAHTNDHLLVKRLRADLDEATDTTSPLPPWLETGAYRFTILLPDPDPARHEQLLVVLKRRGLCDDARLAVAYAPAPRSVLEALRGQHAA